MTADAGVCRAAFASRLFSTCTMRRRSAITGGRSTARSTTRPRRSSPARKALLAPFHQIHHRRRLGRDRERARVDAPRVEPIGDETAHLVRLLDDDAEELAHLGRVEPRRLLQQRDPRSLDRRARPVRVRRARGIENVDARAGAPPSCTLGGWVGPFRQRMVANGGTVAQPYPSCPHARRRHAGCAARRGIRKRRRRLRLRRLGASRLLETVSLGRRTVLPRRRLRQPVLANRRRVELHLNLHVLRDGEEQRRCLLDQRLAGLRRAVRRDREGRRTALQPGRVHRHEIHTVPARYSHNLHMVTVA